LSVALLLTSMGWAARLELLDGRILEGSIGKLPHLTSARNATAVGEPGAPIPKVIVMCDTELKRIFIPDRQIRNVLEGPGSDPPVVFHLKQKGLASPQKVNNVGGVLRVTPFDEFGRRVFAIAGPSGPIEVVQGITRITPLWTEVRGISHEWNMRIATSSIPPETLQKILSKVIDPKQEQVRLNLASFYIQSQRYEDAKRELQQILVDFPTRNDLKAQAALVSRELIQMRARKILAEVDVRKAAGQHRLVYGLLDQFPVPGVAGAILQEVKEKIEVYHEEYARAQSARQTFDSLLAEVPLEDRQRLLPVRDEIFARRARLIAQDVPDWVGFCSLVVQQSQAKNPAAAPGAPLIVPSPGKRIVELIAPLAKAALEKVALNGSVTDVEGQQILTGLNEVLKEPSFYQPADFEDVVLPMEIQDLLNRKMPPLNDAEVLRLNRLLLEASFPQHVQPGNFEGLSMHTLLHLGAFLQLANDTKLLPQERLALATSGWVTGSNSALTNLPTALSLWDVRNLVREYLNEPLKFKREQLLERIRNLEGSTPEQVAKLLRNMLPPTETLPQQVPGFYELTVPLTGIDGEGAATYFVQLPLEYDPHARYPVVISLHGIGTVPAHSLIHPPNPDQGRFPSQVDWWAGPPNAQGVRELGQAQRHGYIVICPVWAKAAQKQYDYSLREHAIVLSSLRDACRRFSIDTDRVFLSGHGMGGDAAFDIGLSHPDLWAGVIPIVGVADRYTAFYYEHAKNVPLYIVAGELDGDKLVRNARELDRFMTRGYDVTVCEYIGRGHEHFADEIQDIFDWMGRRKRDFNIPSFTTKSLRPWDNFFWWVEIEGLPQVVLPHEFPLSKTPRPAITKADVNKNNGVNVTTAANRATLWLSPEIVDFAKPALITINGQRVTNANFELRGDVSIMLEDVRTRGDRQHPFWARFESRR